MTIQHSWTNKALFCAATLLGYQSQVLGAAPQPKNKANYEEFETAFAPTLLEWEPYEVTTFDGWTITVFRVFREKGGPKIPLLV